MHTILFKFKTAYSLVSYWYNCFKYHYITNNPKPFIYSSRQLFYKTPRYMCTFMYATPTFITEVLCLVTQLQLLLMTVTVN